MRNYGDRGRAPIRQGQIRAGPLLLPSCLGFAEVLYLVRAKRGNFDFCTGLRPFCGMWSVWGCANASTAPAMAHGLPSVASEVALKLAHNHQHAHRAHQRQSARPASGGIAGACAQRQAWPRALRWAFLAKQPGSASAWQGM